MSNHLFRPYRKRRLHTNCQLYTHLCLLESCKMRG